MSAHLEFWEYVAKLHGTYSGSGGASQYNVIQVMPVNSYKSRVAGVWPHLPGVTNGCPLIYLCQAL